MKDMHDSGQRQAFDSGAVRDVQTGKGRYDLLPTAALMRDAAWIELGAQKYSDRNWEKGIPISRCVDSLFRHLVKYIAGYQDEDHLAAIRWNAGAIMFYEAEMPHLQDLPKRKHISKEQVRDRVNEIINQAAAMLTRLEDEGDEDDDQYYDINGDDEEEEEVIPKITRLKDTAAIAECRKSMCERCGREAFGEPHHVITVGAGGPDHPCNLIQLCGPCHTHAHTAVIPKGELFQIIANRQGYDPEPIVAAIRRGEKPLGFYA